MELLVLGTTGIISGLLILAGTLYLLGRVTVLGRGMGSAAAAWACLLMGVSLALFDCSRVPDKHRLLWDNVLLPPSMVCLLLSGYLFRRAWRNL